MASGARRKARPPPQVSKRPREDSDEEDVNNSGEATLSNEVAFTDENVVKGRPRKLAKVGPKSDVSTSRTDAGSGDHVSDQTTPEQPSKLIPLHPELSVHPTFGPRGASQLASRKFQHLQRQTAKAIFEHQRKKAQAAGTEKSGKGHIPPKFSNRPDEKLPPISSITAIFRDMLEKADGLGLGSALEKLKDYQLSIGTLCSGTDAPIFALELIDQSTSSLNESPHSTCADL